MYPFVNVAAVLYVVVIVDDAFGYYLDSLSLYASRLFSFRQLGYEQL